MLSASVIKRLTLPVLLLLLSYFAVAINADNEFLDVVTISLAKYNQSDDKAQVFSTFNSFQSDRVFRVDVRDVKSPIGYFVVQVHAYQTQAFLSYDSRFKQNLTVNGTNIGLVQKLKRLDIYRFYVRVKNPSIKYDNQSVFILVAAYNINAPIPGGCNMELEPEIAPYQLLNYTNDSITVDAQLASAPFGLCEKQKISYEMYHMYILGEYAPEFYYSEIQKMITADDIEKYGTQIYKPVPHKSLRRVYSAYKGVGTVYVIVAKYKNFKTAYVPIVTYACNISNLAESCSGPRDSFSIIVMSCVSFLGITVALIGHKYFCLGSFLSGMILGGFFTYINITDDEYLDARVIVTPIAFIVGIIWTIYWCCRRNILRSVMLNYLIVSTLYTSFIMNEFLGDIYYFQNDYVFWGVFLLIIVLFLLSMLPSVHTENIVACSVIGSYSFIFCLDFYTGSNLRYILINIFRRFKVPDFEYAVISPPHSLADLYMALLWALIVVAGFGTQFKLTMKPHPPYPIYHRQQVDERTPLIVHSRPTETESTNRLNPHPSAHHYPPPQ